MIFIRVPVQETAQEIITIALIKGILHQAVEAVHQGMERSLQIRGVILALPQQKRVLPEVLPRK